MTEEWRETYLRKGETPLGCILRIHADLKEARTLVKRRDNEIVYLNNEFNVLLKENEELYHNFYGDDL